MIAQTRHSIRDERLRSRDEEAITDEKILEEEQIDIEAGEETHSVCESFLSDPDQALTMTAQAFNRCSESPCDFLHNAVPNLCSASLVVLISNDQDCG